MDFKKLSQFVDLQKIGVIPWLSCASPECEIDDGDQQRSFHYLKVVDGLSSYADDFGFQWTTLYDDYRKDRLKHLEQFMRLGINPEQLAGKICLDVGCGLGRLSEICLGRAECVFGVDLSKAVIEAGRLIKMKQFIPIQANADCLPINDGSIDFVYSWGVLHHTQDPARTMAELWRVVKPGGVLAFWVYPKNNWYLRRSLLASYYSALNETEMYELSNILTSFAHTLQLTNQSYLNQLCSDLCFSVKNTKEYTRHILFDGLGPSYHYLLDSAWFNEQAQALPSVGVIDTHDSPYTVARIQKLI